MLTRNAFVRLKSRHSFPFKAYTYRRVSSSEFSKFQSVPFTVEKSEAQELFKKHHSKNFLQRQPVSPPPTPIPIYLPYYYFSATTSLTYSAHLGNTTYELRYSLVTGRWHYYPRTRYHDLPRQTLSDHEYPNTLVPLHIYAAYNQPGSWVKLLDTSNVLQLAGNNPLKTISGIEPRIEEFMRPFLGIKSQMVDWLHYNEKERARKYIQRTYDPDEIQFTSSVLNYNLRWEQVYIPVWLFEFTDKDLKNLYKTYVAGWSDTTSGPRFYDPLWSGAIAGVLSAAISSLPFWGVSWLVGPAFGGFIGIVTMLLVRLAPEFSRTSANQETEEQRQYDRRAARGAADEERKSASDSRQQEQQSQEKQQERTKSTYPANDPQGLYQTLEISPTATEAEIGAAYRLLAKKYHPDMVKGEAEKDVAKAKFQQLAAAYEVLKDPRKRREYDRFGTTSI